MAAEFQVHILSSDREFYQGTCVSLVLPTPEGMIGVLAGRANLAAAVEPGILTCRLPDGSTLTGVVSHGIARVENNEVTVLVGSAEKPEEIDAARAERAAQRAREQLLQKLSWQEHLQTQANLTRAVNRMRAAGKTF